jgi:hypothetical protein
MGALLKYSNVAKNRLENEPLFINPDNCGVVLKKQTRKKQCYLIKQPPNKKSITQAYIL